MTVLTYSERNVPLPFQSMSFFLYAKLLRQRLFFLFSRNFYQTQLCHINQRGRNRILSEVYTQLLHQLLLPFFFLHIDKIRDNNTGKIAQTQLKSKLLCRFQINFVKIQRFVLLCDIFPLFTSTTVSASVGSITRFAPDFSQTRGFNAASI